MKRIALLSLILLSVLIPYQHLAAATSQNYEIPNPLSSNDLNDIVQQIGNAILDLAIPVAAAMYIFAGVLYLTAGAKPNNIKWAKDIFWSTTIGLAVIFIGGGFIDLIKSILNIGS